MKNFGRKTAAGILCLAMLTGNLWAPVSDVSAAGEITINEVCTKNTVYPANDGGLYDWIEIYNNSGNNADLSGWGLTDKADTPFRFTFPQGTSVAAGGRLIVFCDGTAAANNNSIAPFGLSASGETLTLTNANGTTADTVEVPPLAKDTSYGRFPEGSGEFYVMNSTPNAPNSAPEGSNAVKEPIFSAESGFYNSGFSLSITAPEGAKVYYTTDGSDPTTSSQEYTSPINIQDMTDTENRLSMRTDISTDQVSAPKKNIDKAAIIRAVSVDSQGRVSSIATRTYFVGKTASSYYNNMKVVSLVTDPDNLFDDEKGIYVLGNVYKQNGGGGFGGIGGWGGFGGMNVMADEPGQPGQQPGGIGGWGGNDWGGNNDWGGGFDWGGGNWGFGTTPANYTQKGREWERPASFEMFDNGESVVKQEVGIRIKGAYSRTAVQKSFNVYSRMDYGKAELEYDFFDGTARKQTNGKKIKVFDGITIRNGGNDVGHAYFRDSINQSLVADRSFATQGRSECMLFIDGEFWGIYQLNERISDKYIEDHYKVDNGDVALVKNGELEEGTDQNLSEWQSVLQQFANADMSSDSSYNEFCQKFDEQNFIDYFAAQIYWSNSDWPQNNYAAWKSNVIDSENPYADGRWRMILFDTESGQGLYNSANNMANSDMYSRISRNTDNFSKMFTKLLKNNTFREKFELTMMDLANYNFDTEKTTPAISWYKDTYKQQILDTYERFYSGSANSETLENEYRTITDFYKNRRSTINDTTKRALNLTGNMVSVTVSNDGTKGSVGLNTLSLDDSLTTWSGQYYTDFPVTVTAQAKEGYTFDHWEVTGGKANGQLTSPELSISLDGAVSVTAVYTNGGSVTPQELDGDYNGDGRVDAEDLKLLKAYLLGNNVTMKNTDIVKDGITNVFDLIELRKLLSR